MIALHSSMVLMSPPAQSPCFVLMDLINLLKIPVKLFIFNYGYILHSLLNT